MTEYNVGKMGWIRDTPDARDYGPWHDKVLGFVLPRIDKLKDGWPQQVQLPYKVDWPQWESPIENQQLQDCTAHSGTGLMESSYRKAGVEYALSRRFLYKMTRNLMGLHGDTGATLRDTMKALAKFGVPPEHFWPYDPEHYESRPSDLVCEMAEKHQALVYYRLDPPTRPISETVHTVRRFLAAGLEMVLGFTVYSSIPQIGERRCDVPFYKHGDKIIGYHAIKLCGYDDSRKIGPDEGAFKFTNSWGTDWGDKGYGWLPYRYLMEYQAVDIWSLVLAESGGGKKPI